MLASAQPEVIPLEGVTLWDASDHELRLNRDLGIPVEHVSHVRFSPDGRTLALSSGQGEIKICRFKDASSDKQTLSSHSRGLVSLEFSSDGRELLSTDNGGQVILWDVNGAKKKQEWKFPGYVSEAKFDPDGLRIITANGNGTIYCFDKE